MGSMTDAHQLHRDSTVCDLHVDTLQRVTRGESLAENEGHLDLARMRQGGLDVQFFAVWVDPVHLARDGRPDRSYARAIELLDAFDREMTRHADIVRPVTSAAQARQEVARGRLAAALGVEGGHAIENDLDKLQEFHRRGVRYLGLTWNNSTDWADAAKEETLHGTRHNGLSPFGVEVVQRMNDLGMIVDLSHAAESTFWKVLEVSRVPVMASHSDAHALNPHFRNLKDEQIRALADKEGLVGINFFCMFLDAEYAAERQQAEALHRAELDAIEKQHPEDFPTQSRKERELLRSVMKHVPVPASRIVDHVEHIVGLVGADHVALGSDFDGTNALPDDLQDVSQLPLLTQLLQERGFSDADIRKILGENVLRFFERVCG
jgi:membrane dipeptidase